MGGIGSTRWGAHTRQLAIEDGHLQLRIGEIRRLLARPHGGRRTLEWPDLTFTAVVTHRPEFIHEEGWPCAELVLSGSWILLVGEPARLAGTRWRFSCPKCGQRRDRLFTDPARLGEIWSLVAHGQEPEREWKCRECAGLTYRMGQVGSLERAERRVCKIVSKFGVNAESWDVSLPPPPRPRSMHKTVYESLVREYSRAADAYDETFSRGMRQDAEKMIPAVLASRAAKLAQRQIFSEDLDKSERRCATKNRPQLRGTRLQ